MKDETRQSISDSTAVHLSARQWLCVLGLSLGLAWLLPVVWTAFEVFEPVPHYRVPYELSNDYWLYERWLDQLSPDAIPVVGDSVVWGEYTAHDGTLSRFLGDATGAPFANTGLNGLYPLALWGLIEHHGGALANRRVLLHCNLLWMSDPEADMQIEKEQVFNHPALVPQFAPRIPCYRVGTDIRLGRMLERQLEPLSWVRHLQQTYFDQKSAPEWTLADDGQFPPTFPNTYRLPLGVQGVPLSFESPSAKRGLASERHKSWSANSPGSLNMEWVTPKSSLQWQAFRRLAKRLQGRGSDLLVIVGPLNEHMMNDETREKYIGFRTAVTVWLKAEEIRFIVPGVLPSAEFADASHPLTEGYERLAKRLADEPVFRAWLGQ
ncbi:MAG TPA: hypothetical protein QGG93_09630 [Verrucomicrobiota bacterium]|nr:hypothetical protein [Verrucomicrobiota bacterium]